MSSLISIILCQKAATSKLYQTLPALLTHLEMLVHNMLLCITLCADSHYHSRMRHSHICTQHVPTGCSWSSLATLGRTVLFCFVVTVSDTSFQTCHLCINEILRNCDYPNTLQQNTILVHEIKQWFFDKEIFYSNNPHRDKAGRKKNYLVAKECEVKKAGTAPSLVAV